MTYPGKFSFNFHPVADSDSGQQIFYNLFYSNLVRRGSSAGTIVADLASTWENVAATTYTFRLNDKAKWSDGQPVTADDVVFTATAAAQNADKFTGYTPTAWLAIDGAAAIAGTTKPLTGIKAVDPHTVQITLAAPDSQYLTTLANAVHVILPQHALAAVAPATWAKSAFATQTPIGSGPYKLAKVVPDQYLEFAANMDYYQGAPKIKKIFVKTGMTEAGIVNQLKTGELDVALGMDPTNQSLLASTSRLKTSVDVGVGTMYIQFRVDNPQVADERVRQAFYYGVDRASMLKSLFGNAGKVLWAPAGFDQTGADLNHYDYDPAKAKQLLDAANFDYAKPLTLPYASTESGWDKIAATIKDDMGKIGVNITLAPMDETAWSSKLSDPNPNAFSVTLNCCGTEGRSPDASSVYYNKTFVGTKYYNDQLIGLFAAGRAESDPAKQATIYAQAAKILNTAVPYNWLWARSGLNVLPTALQGASIYQSVIDTTGNAWQWSLR
ncbi:ABC transporter substrate-binding protein [Dactylosporangium sucinum]|nr:ABC transporter substrate-binding protein [Dactylosporangium sucinum]